MNHYFQRKGNSRKMRSSCHERGIKKKTPSPYQESNFKSSDSALYRDSTENIWPIFCLTLETRRKRHLSLILHRAPNLPSPLICLVKRLIIQNCK